jgi:hypothetical protein
MNERFAINRNGMVGAHPRHRLPTTVSHNDQTVVGLIR